MRAHARQRLSEWIDAAAPSSLARLAATPHEARVLRPAAVALVAALLATALLLMPAHDHSTVASTSADSSTRGPRAQATARDEAREQRAELDSPDSARDHSSATSSDDEGRRDGGGQAASTDGAVRRRAGHNSCRRSAARRDRRSRRAGRARRRSRHSTKPRMPHSRRPGKASCATTLRTLAVPPQATSRADQSLAADYESATADGTVTRPDAAFTPAAAAPQARRKPSLGPVEQAYVRAYFAAPGATP